MKKRRKPGDPYERQPWTREQDDAMRALYPNTHNVELSVLLGRTEPAIVNRAAKLKLRKSEDYKATHSTRFEPGLVPWNTGKRWVAGGRSAETRFKPGQRPGNWQPIGTLRINGDGNLQRKISEEPGGPHKRWRNVSELVWVEANGPVPPGHIVVFKPGRWTNQVEEITLDRIECISRAERMRRNSCWNNLPPEVARLVQLKGCINRQINRINKKQKEGNEHTAHQ